MKRRVGIRTSVEQALCPALNRNASLQDDVHSALEIMSVIARAHAPFTYTGRGTSLCHGIVICTHREKSRSPVASEIKGIGTGARTHVLMLVLRPAHSTTGQVSGIVKIKTRECDSLCSQAQEHTVHTRYCFYTGITV